MFSLITIVAMAVMPLTSNSAEFKSLISKIESHPNIDVVHQEYVGLASRVAESSSFKDPNFRLSAVNVPTSSLSFDRTPMSSKQLMLSQTIPLSSRLSHLDDQEERVKLAGEGRVKYEQYTLRAMLWSLAARLDSASRRLKIVDEGLNWLRKVEKSTERLYSTGKTNQINLLEIKVRSTDLETQKEKLSFQIKEAENQVGYLVGTPGPVKIEQVPWGHLDILFKSHTSYPNHEEQALENEILAAKSKAKSVNLGFVPDLTIGAIYAFRENVDGQGDFVSGFVQFSIPLWGKNASKVSMAQAERYRRESLLAKYRLNKSTKIETYKKQIESIRLESKLNVKAIKYAEAERKLAAKRYSLGKMRVFDLLEIELRLRKKKNRDEVLKENLRTTIVRLLLLSGSDLNAES